jgi:hypothetical protein
MLIEIGPAYTDTTSTQFYANSVDQVPMPGRGSNAAGLTELDSERTPLSVSTGLLEIRSH